MRRTALYSRSRPPGMAPAGDAPAEPMADAAPGPQETAAPSPTRRQRLRAALAHPGLMWVAVALLGGALAFTAGPWGRTAPRKLTQDDINAAVMHTLTNKVLPSQAARAAATVGPALVRVEGLVAGKKDRKGHAEMGRGVGTGVVIIDNGTILTNLHVVQGSESITVTFADGLEAPAAIVNVAPENDLAVLRAQKIPDDLQAATMRSTADLQPGDEVVAIGFPFGIGPSVSAGVV